MRRWWGEVVTDHAGMVRTMVRARGLKAGLSDAEIDEAVSDALESFTVNLIWTYDGTSPGELVNALKRLSGFRVIDEQRDVIRQRERQVPTVEDHGDDLPEERARRKRTPAEMQFFDDDLRAHETTRRFEALIAFVRERVGKVDGLTQGLFDVFERRMRGLDYDEIAEELGISKDNAYQRWRRVSLIVLDLRAAFEREMDA